MKNFYSMTTDEVMHELQTEEKGLNDIQVENMRKLYGSNVLHEVKKPSPMIIFFSQFKDFLVWILLVAATLSALLGKIESALVIIIVVILNAILGTVQHLKAEESLQALKALSSPRTRVMRNGETITIASKDIVIGDIIIVEAGDFVSADGRIINSFSLKVDESTLTGESVSTEKVSSRIEAKDLSPGDQLNMLFSGTHITYGRGLAVVTGVGTNTEIGKIATMLEQAQDKETPLQKSLDDFGKRLAAIIIAIAVLIFAINVYRGNPMIDVMMFSIALAVAAIPEALSSIVTIVLAIGTRKMAKENAIIRKLHAVEGLGSVSVICSDKTGTLTQNKMTVKRIFTRNHIYKENELDIKLEQNFKLLMMSMLCNDAITTEKGDMGDPTEIALVNLGELYGYDELKIRETYHRIAELPFDSNRKLMSTLHDIDEKRIMITKGALDVIIQNCKFVDDETGIRSFIPEDKIILERINNELSQEGLRVLAFAYKEFAGERLDFDDEKNMTFIGLVAMMDPPRPESKEAVESCKRAGIRTVMITGDHIITASAIAKEIGILDDSSEAIEGYKIESMTDEELMKLVSNVSVYARVSPEHKIRIVKAWQELGYAVAMTGDGVNDAPALKQADIGVAMGITGTEVSKSASSIILADDNFATIVKAVSYGRSIYRNIMNSVKFLLSGNMAGILTILYASVLNLPAPFAPIHLLFINLLTDSLPAIAIGIEAPSDSVMQEKPRDTNEPLLSKRFALEIFLQGLVIAIGTITAYYIGMQVSVETAITMAFAVLCLSRLVHGFNCRTKEPLTVSTFFSNRYSWIAFVLGFMLLLIVITWDPMKGIFEVANLTGQQYFTIIGLSLIPLIVVQTYKRLK